MLMIVLMSLSAGLERTSNNVRSSEFGFLGFFQLYETYYCYAKKEVQMIFKNFYLAAYLLSLSFLYTQGYNIKQGRDLPYPYT